MHFLASMVTREFRNTALLVSAHYSNPFKCTVTHAATGEFFGTIEKGESIFSEALVWDVTLNGGGVIECDSLADVKDVLMISYGFPTEAANRNYSKPVYMETDY